MDKIPITPDGLTRLQDELRRLKSEERPTVIRAIAEARAHGDLSENAEYHAAKERQAFIEGRVAELEDKISRAEVIDPSKISGDTVMFGATVKIVEEDSSKETTYRIVGQDESDIAKGLISVSSPLGKALIGKAVGDQVEVNAPSGARYYEIMSVDYE